MKTWLRINIVILLAFSIFASAMPAQAQDSKLPVVRAVLFYSPTCPHCHQVINESLPPIIEKYGKQLLIVGIDTSTAQGQELYLAASTAFQVPQERGGVPALYIGDVHLVGSIEIPERLPELIDAGLAQGGIDWPAIPGVDEFIAQDHCSDNSVSADTGRLQ